MQPFILAASILPFSSATVPTRSWPLCSDFFGPSVGVKRTLFSPAWPAVPRVLGFSFSGGGVYTLLFLYAQYITTPPL